MSDILKIFIKGIAMDILDDSIETLEEAQEFISDAIDYGKERLLDLYQKMAD